MLVACLLLTIVNVFNKLLHKKETSSQSLSTSNSLIHTRIHMHQQTFLPSSVIFNTHSLFIIVKAEWKKFSSGLGHYNTRHQYPRNTKDFQETVTHSVLLTYSPPVNLSPPFKAQMLHRLTMNHLLKLILRTAGFPKLQSTD